MKLITSRIIADNATHAKLFSERAKELGENPEKYKPPQIGQKIYDILESYTDPVDEFAYAWGSLAHFSALLDIYHGVADPKSLEIIEKVQSDVEGHLCLLKDYFENEGLTSEQLKQVEEVKMIADKIYTDREDEEIKWYAA